VSVNKNELLPGFIQSLLPYYDHGKITEAFADVKREELLIILLQPQPELAGLLFDYGIPEKINLEEFMNRNYTFNVSLERFAYLTGRSLSAFKRDFKTIFNQTPSRWLVQKRLQEAYFLIDKKNRKPSEIYFDLGFEDLSHFSFAFKKVFGLTPTELTGRGRSATGRTLPG
jgi:AraC-like DNA-binding protein